jgi:hypothetical protein
MKTKFAVWCIAFGVLFGNAAFAQTALTRAQLIAAGVDADRYLAAQSVSQDSPAPAWGTSSDTGFVLPASAFTPRLGLALWGGFGGGERYRTTQTIGGTVVTSDQFFDAPVGLPVGAKITGLRANMCDDNAARVRILLSGFRATMNLQGTTSRSILIQASLRPEIRAACQHLPT